jgi:hypothetical protein
VHGEHWRGAAGPDGHADWHGRRHEGGRQHVAGAAGREHHARGLGTPARAACHRCAAACVCRWQQRSSSCNCRGPRPARRATARRLRRVVLRPALLCDTLQRRTCPGPSTSRPAADPRAPLRRARATSRPRLAQRHRARPLLLLLLLLLASRQRWRQ